MPTAVVNQMLRKYEATHLTEARKMPRFDTSQLPSNSPIEDHHTELSNDSSDAWYFGIFDGHAGKHCSQKLASRLVQQVRHDIEKVAADVDQDITELVTQSMIKSFESLDQEIVWGSLGEVIVNTEKAIHASLPAAVSGSCAIVGYVDIKAMRIYVANTGDSRAVIGSLDSNHNWSPIKMSNDQNTTNKKERERLYAEHPGEESTIISKGRVLGSLAPTRAFGDSRYKWSARTQLAVKDHFFPRMRMPPAHYRTPPYVTATPEVLHHQLTSQDRFMVIASDGLFDLLSNDEIVSLVGTYLQQKSDSLPNNPNTDRWAYVDDNAATHLIRNALGGSSRKELSKMLSAEAPYSRNLRDDITVTVIFFEDTSSS
ncbi:protein serine/threonine phosphatase 2C [Basidiobolus meristosporus CBS 931.73]|uniref:Protein serine/threonine phosphatase 2C n=1 Tax=Basidiobolus meristosporus CBS 931.73 TaxID=1314790 RepID=A0A1Y1Z8I7_9FUNG|nr:protein serine/threonine phosphatase 2C [Basidiobolus meristosporus CBS 931.73]|eukprot:ORY06327.1 protein serine/threonine phosphatase 2C [Basidiobolus meristosporus CBS 931.73]